MAEEFDPSKIQFKSDGPTDVTSGDESESAKTADTGPSLADKARRRAKLKKIAPYVQAVAKGQKRRKTEEAEAAAASSGGTEQPTAMQIAYQNIASAYKA